MTSTVSSSAAPPLRRERTDRALGVLSNERGHERDGGGAVLEQAHDPRDGVVVRVASEGGGERPRELEPVLVAQLPLAERRQELGGGRGERLVAPAKRPGRERDDGEESHRRPRQPRRRVEGLVGPTRPLELVDGLGQRLRVVAQRSLGDVGGEPRQLRGIGD